MFVSSSEEKDDLWTRLAESTHLTQEAVVSTAGSVLLKIGILINTNTGRLAQTANVANPN